MREHVAAARRSNTIRARAGNCRDTRSGGRRCVACRARSSRAPLRITWPPSRRMVARHADDALDVSLPDVFGIEEATMSPRFNSRYGRMCGPTDPGGENATRSTSMWSPTRSVPSIEPWGSHTPAPAWWWRRDRSPSVTAHSVTKPRGAACGPRDQNAAARSRTVVVSQSASHVRGEAEHAPGGSACAPCRGSGRGRPAAWRRHTRGENRAGTRTEGRNRGGRICRSPRIADIRIILQPACFWPPSPRR